MPDLDKVSIVEYLAWLNRDTDFPLTTDLSHWAEYGVTTARDLGDYLDNECACNLED